MSEAELSLHELLQACGALSRMLEQAMQERTRMRKVLAEYRAMPSYEFKDSGGARRQVFGTKESIASLQAFIGEAAVRAADAKADLKRALQARAGGIMPPIPSPTVIPPAKRSGDEIVGEGHGEEAF